MRHHFYCSARRWGRCPARHPFELSADNGRRLLPATPAVPPFGVRCGCMLFRFAGQQIGAATGRLLCGGFLPGECDLRMFDLGTHSRSRGFADRARHHALSIGHHLMPFWNCRHCSAEISTSWTWNLHLFPDRLSEARSARIGEVKNLTKDAGAAEAARSFVDLSALRRDPARFGLCRFCASCSCKSSGCEPPGN